ncbi:M14 family metallopeptidase [Paraburkholderia sp. J7]|uniref:M14 family metallopeptidase n=1 Tax=Paraburkholderia sp. J7 TaxID=2805438 RepID=UPI002AB6C847|nr:M14 family metallopeptidase [Paraburkholderia sp. J7]
MRAILDPSSFSLSYAQARKRFLAACAQAGLAVQHHIHPMVGRDGEELAIDVARMGAPDAANLLVISSGCHGIEGFCGSGVQLDLLRDADWLQRCKRDDLAVLYIHALNPYGFSWERRVTHENVDLNRNFRDFGASSTQNSAYREIASLLVPRRCPPTLTSTLGLLGYALRHGRRKLQTAISAGQQVDPQGLFYVGNAPTWSHLRIREILREHARQCRRIAWIDVHTGLGPAGVGERIYKGQQDAASIARARQWWGDVTSSEEGNSSSTVVGGTLDLAVMSECPQAEYNGLTLEYGTLPGRQVLEALRAEQWLYQHPGTNIERSQAIKQRLRAAFYVETDDWKRTVLAQAREVLDQSLAGLGTPLPQARAQAA